MKVGDLVRVRDNATFDIAIVTQVNPVWVDPESGGWHEWDYLVYTSEHGITYVDADEIELIQKVT